MSSPRPNGSLKMPDEAPAPISTPRAPPSQLSPPRGSDPTKASAESNMEDALASGKKKVGQCIVTLKVRAPLEDKASEGDSAAPGEKSIKKHAVSFKTPPSAGAKASGSDSVTPGQKNDKKRIVILKLNRPVDNKAGGSDSAAPGDKNVKNQAVPFKMSATEDTIGDDYSVAPVVKSVKKRAVPFKMAAVENDKPSDGGPAASGEKPVKKRTTITLKLNPPVEDQASGGDSAAPGDKNVRKRAVPFRMAAVEDEVSGVGSIAPQTKSIYQVKSQGQNEARKGDQPARDLAHKTVATGIPPMGTVTRPTPVDRRRSALTSLAVCPLPKHSMDHRVEHATVAAGIDRSRQTVTQAEHRSQPGATAHAESGQHVRGAKSQTSALSKVVATRPYRDIPQARSIFSPTVIPDNYQTSARVRFHLPDEPFIKGHHVPELHPIRFRQIEVATNYGRVTVPLYYPFVPKEAGVEYAIRFPDIPCDIFGLTKDDILPSFHRPASYQEALRFGWLMNETYKSLAQKYPTTVSARDPTAMPTMASSNSHIQGNSGGLIVGGSRTDSEAVGRRTTTATGKRTPGKRPAAELGDEGEDKPRKKAMVSKGRVAAPSPGLIHEIMREMEKELLEDIMAVIPDI